jgi:hypothetical protein
MTVQIDPNPLVENGSSAFAAVIQVETSPSFAGDTVDIASSQVQATCTTFYGFVGAGTDFHLLAPPTPLVFAATLDDDGNATVALYGVDCAPGSDLIEADLTTAPYGTALGTLVLDPPVVTPSGLFAYPTSSGTATGGEVETGNGATGSDIFAVFNLETDPVYAEQTAEISFDQLEVRCGGLLEWEIFPPSGFTIFFDRIGGTSYGPVPTTLDDDGNATFLFVGESCAAGSSVVTADVEAGSHPTYITNFNIVAPQPTI